MSIDKAKAALESCNGMPVSGAGDMALLAIANALVAIAERGAEIERTEDKLNALVGLDDGAERSNNGVTRWHELFGTPERAARTYLNYFLNGCDGATCSDGCPFFDTSAYMNCALGTDDYDALLEWLKGAAE